LLNELQHVDSVLKRIQIYSVQRKSVNIMTSLQAKIKEDTYLRVMHILQETADLTQRDLAEKLGMSVDRLNYCLKPLMEKSLLKTRNITKSKNTFDNVYVLTLIGMEEKADIAHRFLQRKIDEYEASKAEIEASKDKYQKMNKAA
jgi:EPS-associated MarR family transcriptional regulator